MFACCSEVPVAKAELELSAVQDSVKTEIPVSLTSADTSGKIEGGCYCKAVRVFAPKEPLASILDHAEDARRFYGSPFLSGFLFNTADVVIQGETIISKAPAPGSTIERILCAKCKGRLGEHKGDGKTVIGVSFFGNMGNLTYASKESVYKYKPTEHLNYDQRAVYILDGLKKLDSKGKEVPEKDKTDEEAKFDPDTTPISCLCGKTTGRWKTPPAINMICHCTGCASYSGGIQQIAVIMSPDSMEWSQPLHWFENQESGSTRGVCPDCYSNLQNYKKDGVGWVSGSTFPGRFASAFEMQTTNSFMPGPLNNSAEAFYELPGPFGNPNPLIWDPDAFTVTLETPLGLALNTAGPLTIKSVNDGGAMQKWNKENGEKVVPKSRILDVNGKAGTVEELLAAIKSGGKMDLRIAPPKYWQK